MQIRSLNIRRYRGIENFTWRPGPGVNCLIGPGDSHKSTVLAAISLLLAPYPLGPCSEFDYFQRRIADGFEIEAYIGNLDLQLLGTEQRVPHLFGWQNNAPVPLPEGEAEPVLRCQVRGNQDLELVYELPIQGADPMPPFSSGLRRKLMLARLAGEERATRDLRLGVGSLLDRHLKTRDMRASVHQTIAAATNELEVPAPAAAALTLIRETFRTAGLPTDIHLGLVPTQGVGLVGMVALVSGANVGEAIPLANAGTGTKQLALLSLSAALAGIAPILVIDEPERGLEPYRQRKVAKRLIELAGPSGQVFLTTHAPSILEALPPDAIWRMRSNAEPLRFDGDALGKLLHTDPEAFFAPFPILCEGATEVGLLEALLPALINRDLDAIGVRLVDGGGQPKVLDIADRFIAAAIACAAFLDNEDVHRGRRRNINQECTCLIWDGAINIEDAVCKWLPRNALFDLLQDAAQASGIDVRHLEDQVHLSIQEAHRLGGPRDLRSANYDDATIRSAFYAAMHGRSWFKSKEGGRILGHALARLGMPSAIQGHLEDFGQRLRAIIQ